MNKLLNFGLKHPLLFIVGVGIVVAAIWFVIIKVIEVLTHKN